MYCPNCGKEIKNKICEGCKNETVVTSTSSAEGNLEKIKSATQLMLENVTNFDGRTSRSNYWWAVLTLVGISLVGMILGSISEFLEMIVMLGLVVLSWTLTIRRLHDVGKSWYYMLWQCLFPPITLYFLVQKGDEGANQYGEPDNK